MFSFVTVNNIKMPSSQLLIALFASFTIHAVHAASIAEVSDLTDVIEDNSTSIPKIPKCCPLNEALLDPEKGCLPTTLDFKPFFADSTPKLADVIIGFKCEHGKYRLEPEEVSQDEYHLMSDGTLSIPFQKPYVLSPLDYCLDNTRVQNSTEIRPFLCFPEETERYNAWSKVFHIIFPIGSLTSVPFLAVVVLIYLGIPELRTTNGKVLACHSACLAFAYFSLSMVQLIGQQLPHTFCIIMAFIIQFSFMCCFFWLNLLCLHTWLQLQKGVTEDNLMSGRKVFLFYSLYGWGFPVVIITVSIVMDLTPTIPSTYLKPNFGFDSCWFKSETAAFPYFYGPIAFLLIINLVFFCMTARVVHKSGPAIVERITTLEQAARSVIVQKRKRAYVQAIILFLAMGLNWMLEVISWSVGGPPQLWLFTDIINTLQGIIIFYIFFIRDPRVRRLGTHYLRRVCCCHKDTDMVEPEESVDLNRQHNGTEKMTFKKIIPLLHLK